MGNTKSSKTLGEQLRELDTIAGARDGGRPYHRGYTMELDVVGGRKVIVYHVKTSLFTILPPDGGVPTPEERRLIHAQAVALDDDVVGPPLAPPQPPPRPRRRPTPAIAYPAPWPEEPEANDGDLCAICLARRSATVNVPCGHACLCVTCAASGKLTDCPICRAALTSIVRVYR